LGKEAGKAWLRIFVRYREQKYCCCQLIAAINARIFLGGGDVTDEEFEAFVDLVFCRYGSALRIKEVYPLLGLSYEDNRPDLIWIKDHLPVELKIYDPVWGFHSILVVGVCDDGLNLVNAWTSKALWEEFEFPPEHLLRCRSFNLLEHK